MHVRQGQPDPGLARLGPVLDQQRLHAASASATACDHAARRFRADDDAAPRAAASARPASASAAGPNLLDQRTARSDAAVSSDGVS